MIRRAILGGAATMVVAACGLVPSLGSQPVTYRVTNTAPVPVVLTIETSAGVLAGAVQPASLPPRATGRITFLLPPGDDYWIKVNGTSMFPASDVITYSPATCAGTLMMEVNPDGSGGIGCEG